MSDPLLVKGNRQIGRQDYVGAIATLTQLIESSPHHGEAFCRRAVAQFQNGNVHGAVSDYSRTLELNSEHPKAYYGRALARFTLKNPTGALKDVNAALNWKPDYAAAYQLRARVYRQQSSIEAAIADFKQAAKLYIDELKADAAKECVKAATQLQERLNQVRAAKTKAHDSHSEQDYFTHVMYLIRQGKTHQAMQDINWVLRSDPRDGKAHCCRGLVHLKNGSARDAIADFNQAIALDFSEAIAYHNRGKARLMLGDYHGACKDCNQSLSIEKNADAFVIRGNAARMMNDENRAIADYDAALKLDDECAEAYFERGMTYETLSRFQEAESNYQQAISLFCLNEEWIQHKTAQARLKLVQKALLGTDSAQKKNLSDRLYQKLLSLLDGSPKIAEAVLDRKRKKYPGHAEEWYIESAIQDLEQSGVDFWGTV
ncbi:MAG: tetratricopeptide repeat protein [Cyanobacteria bacterium P01_F01_bin.42]